MSREVDCLPTFIDGTAYGDSFMTAAGTVQVLAETHIFGDHLVLDEILVFPEEEDDLNVGAPQMFSIFRHIRDLARAQGFTDVTVSYHRVGPNHDGRTITRTRSLR